MWWTQNHYIETLIPKITNSIEISMEGLVSPTDQQTLVTSFLEVAQGQTAATARQFLQVCFTVKKHFFILLISYLCKIVIFNLWVLCYCWFLDYCCVKIYVMCFNRLQVGNLRKLFSCFWLEVKLGRCQCRRQRLSLRL